jgi:hypothetical protein
MVDRWEGHQGSQPPLASCRSSTPAVELPIRGRGFSTVEMEPQPIPYPVLPVHPLGDLFTPFALPIKVWPSGRETLVPLNESSLSLIHFDI